MGEESEWKQFFDSNPAPPNLATREQQLEKFCSHQSSEGRPIALVTSGGTTVPLELNTVRFVDNFSSGARGSASAEYFLKQGWAVVFLFRSGSLQPFARHLHPSSLLSALQEQPTSSSSSSLLLPPGPECSRLLPVVREAREAEGRLLQIDFSSLSSYLWLLRAAALALAERKEGASGSKETQCENGSKEMQGENGSSVRNLLYLAAAVSDFYIPNGDLPVHKIQSSEGAPSIQLQCVPKMLAPLAQHWKGKSALVSFKLETDSNILVMKARKALDKYGHKLVIGNLLDTRKREVLLVFKDRMEEVMLSEAELETGLEIEEKIISRLIKIVQQL